MGDGICAPHPPRFRTYIASNALCQHALGTLGRLRVFVRIRIYRIGGIYRISLRPACAFAITENLGKTIADEGLPVERRALEES